MNKVKKIGIKSVSCIIAFLMVLSVIVVGDVTVNAESTENIIGTEVDNVKLSATDSLGSMISNEYNEEESDCIANTIYDIEVENNKVLVDLQALTKARLVVGIYDEAGEEMYFSSMCEVSVDDRIVSVDFKEMLPQFFIVKAYLLDVQTNIPLCKQYEFDTYSEYMQEFFSKTTKDFSADRVLNLDSDNSDNFLVYNDDTILIDNKNGVNNVITIDEEAKKYVIGNVDDEIRMLQSGDIFALPYENKRNIIVRISSISIENNTATIYGAEIELKDAFDYIRIESDQGTDETTVDNSQLESGVEFLGIEEENSSSKYSEAVGAKLVDVEANTGQSLSYKLEKKIGTSLKISGEAGCKFEASVKCYYDAKLFKKDEVEFSFAIKYEANIKASIELGTDKDNKIKIKLGMLGFSPVPGVYVDFTPSIVVEGKVKVELSGVLKGQVGKKFKNGVFSDNSKKAQFHPEFKVSGELFIGFSLEPEIGIVGGIIKASAEAKTGVKIKAEMKYSGEEINDPDEIHQCKACIDGEIDWYTELSLKLSLFDAKNLSWKADLFKLTVKICDFYFSFDTGKFALTTCPNLTYKQTIYVTDSSGKPIEEADVNGKKTDSTGKVVVYLHAGTCTITAQKAGFVTRKGDLKVEGKGKYYLTLYAPNESSTTSFDPSIVKNHRVLSPTDVYKYDGHFYKLFDSVCDDWDEAKQYCESLGGHLATIGDKQENDALYKYITETSYLNAYFGYSDARQEGTWEWVTNENITYENWANGEPNNENIGEDYAAFYWKFTDGKWNDGNFDHGTASDEKVFICEWESDAEYQYGLNQILSGTKTKTVVLKIDSNSVGSNPYSSFTRTGLIPKSEAILFVVEGTSDNYKIDDSTLLYVSQNTVNSNGTVNLNSYGDFDSKSWVALIIGECEHQHCEWVDSCKATVHSKGIKLYQCTECGSVIDSEEIPMVVIEKDDTEMQIFFADKKDWSKVNVHYWGNGETSWPGIQMTYIDTDSKGRKVYSTVIPIGVSGIVFSGDSGSPQTIDINDNIIDGSGWTISDNSSGSLLDVEKYNYTYYLPSVVLIGDVNNDTIIDAKDRVSLTRHLAKWCGYENIDIIAADVNADGNLNVKDRIILARHLANWNGYDCLPLVQL